MIKVYYLDKIIAFGTTSEFQSEPQNWHFELDINPTNLDKLFEISNLIAVICDKPIRESTIFIAKFPLIEAGGGLVRNPLGEPLMIYRNQRWDLPKGKLEPREAISECAIREVQEECSITNLTLGEYICCTYHLYRIGGTWVAKCTHWWAMSHSGQGKLEPQTIEGITRVEWVRKEDIAERLDDTFPTIREVFAQNMTSYV